MGGAGKTPVVAYLVEYFLSKNKKPGVLSRGYGRKSKSIQIVNNDAPNPAVFFGDEAFMLYSKYGVNYAVGSNRFKSGEALLNRANLDCFILDDAFQHRKLFRNLNIVLLDVSQEEYFYQMFPLGRLRENFLSLKRADIILFTKVNLISSDRLLRFKKGVGQVFPLDNTLTCDLGYFLSKIQSLKNKAIDKNQPIVLISAIANPLIFEKNILEKTFTVKKHFIYKDHFVFSLDEVQKIVTYCKQNEINQIICTEKDWHKLKEFSDLQDTLFYTELEIEFLTNKDLFLSKVEGL